MKKLTLWIIVMLFLVSAVSAQTTAIADVGLTLTMTHIEIAFIFLLLFAVISYFNPEMLLLKYLFLGMVFAYILLSIGQGYTVVQLANITGNLNTTYTQNALNSNIDSSMWIGIIIFFLVGFYLLINFLFGSVKETFTTFGKVFKKK